MNQARNDGVWLSPALLWLILICLPEAGWSAQVTYPHEASPYAKTRPKAADCVRRHSARDQSLTVLVNHCVGKRSFAITQRFTFGKTFRIDRLDEFKELDAHYLHEFFLIVFAITMSRMINFTFHILSELYFKTLVGKFCDC